MENEGELFGEIDRFLAKAYKPLVTSPEWFEEMILNGEVKVIRHDYYHRYISPSPSIRYEVIFGKNSHITFGSEALWSYAAVREAVLMFLGRLPERMSPNKWHDLLARLINDCERVEHMNEVAPQ